MSSVEQTLAEGTRLHQAGRLAEAEQIYRRVLSTHPNHPHAVHQLGILAMQARQFDAAITLFRRALQIAPVEATFHANLGEAYRHAGQTELAVTSYRRALELNPNLAPVHTVLGIVLYETGQLDDAINQLRQALRLQPGEPRANTWLGFALDALDRYAEAEACFREALRGDDSAEAHFNLGSTLQCQGRTDEAIAAYRAALDRDPNHTRARNNLATQLRTIGALDEAVQHLQAALSVDPRFAPAHANLALVHDMQERLDEAVARYRAALAIDPNMLAAHEGLGTVLQKQGQFAEAMESFRFVLSRRPDDPETLSNLGVCYGRAGRHDEAIAHFRRSLELRPDYVPAHSNLALSLRSLGQLDEAIDFYRRTIELAPHDAEQHSSLLYTVIYHPGYDPRALFEEHRAWGRRHADPLAADSPPFANDRSPERRLRIGYVSPNFYAQAISFFVEPILASHDRQRCEVFCYADVKKPDGMTACLRGYADQWRDTLRLSDEELWQSIRADQIDVLVDLTGHINGGRRLLTFARRAAPVQVTYLGYQNTTGMQAMDYRLTDAYADPPGATDSCYTERLVRLPTTFFVYMPTPAAPEVGPLPAAAAGYVTFGSVNNFTKITPDVLRTWAEILRRVADARLLIRADMTQSLRKRLTDFFAAEGIEAARLELANRLPRQEYLELISRLDVALDPFPFNGHTTTCDCLWQGVPVVTLSGDTYVSRFGGSGLATLGLAELIAHSREEYVETVVALAQDRPRLENYRRTLRQRMSASPLLDFKTFTRNLEDAYRRMWADWCAAEGAARP